MINKSSLALVAALVAGSAGVAHADAMIDDVNTGLPTMIYNAPLAQLQQQGLPLKASAATYLKQHSQNVAARTHRGTVSVRTSAQALGVYQTNQPTFFDEDNKQSGHY
jgi:hypothetical protein